MCKKEHKQRKKEIEMKVQAYQTQTSSKKKIGCDMNGMHDMNKNES